MTADGYSLDDQRQPVKENDIPDIINRFKNHEYDILLGTQMISKGLNFPLVTLVGVINADATLNIPDFRSGERTFALLSQVPQKPNNIFSNPKIKKKTQYMDLIKKDVPNISISFLLKVMLK